MAFTIEDVEYLARLARLDLTDDEKKKYHEQLVNILDYFEVMGDLDVSDISAIDNVLPHDSVMRADEPRHGLDPDPLLRNLADTDKEGDQFRVDAILEEGN